jgi:two-component system, chemotaxis family, CheB/CheR fusion protein
MLPLMDGNHASGILVFALEATEHARLKEQMSRIAEQHATAIEELQSTNEELETTNEELQSTNEELETTNEELQSTNEELETTVEELQATNAELATLNTELEHRTAELRRMDVSHQSFLNNLEQGVLVLDRAGTIETWNQAAERMWGLRHAQIVGRQLGHLPLGQVASAAREAYERVLRTAQPEDVPNIPYILPGGESRHANMRLSPLKDGDGEVIGVLGVLAPTDAASPRS